MRETDRRLHLLAVTDGNSFCYRDAYLCRLANPVIAVHRNDRQSGAVRAALRLFYPSSAADISDHHSADRPVCSDAVCL